MNTGGVGIFIFARFFQSCICSAAFRVTAWSWSHYLFLGNQTRCTCSKKQSGVGDRKKQPLLISYRGVFSYSWHACSVLVIRAVAGIFYMGSMLTLRDKNHRICLYISSYVLLNLTYSYVHYLLDKLKKTINSIPRQYCNEHYSWLYFGRQSNFFEMAEKNCVNSVVFSRNHNPVILPRCKLIGQPPITCEWLTTTRQKLPHESKSLMTSAANDTHVSDTKRPHFTETGSFDFK